MAIEDVINAMKALDLDKLREDAMADIRSGKKTRRQAAVKRLRAIDGLKRSGASMDDLVVKRVPVLPAAFRPYTYAGGTFIPGDANELYSDLHKAVQGHKEIVSELGEEAGEDSASYLRSAVAAVYGYDDSPNPKIKARKVSGFLTKVLGCHDDETEILTRKYGWIPFKDLPEDTEVATVNPYDNNFEWQQPSAYIHAPYEGCMFHFEVGRRVDALVTPDHEMFLKKRVVGTQTDSWEVMNKGWQKLPAYRAACDSGRSWFMTAAAGWAGGTIPEVPAALSTLTTIEYAELCGWWLSEGSSSKTRLGVSQSRGANPLKHARLEELFSKIESVSRVDTKAKGNRQASTCWNFGDKVLCEDMVSKFGEKAVSKYISREVMDWDSDHLKSLIRGYLLGDGVIRQSKNNDCQKPFTAYDGRNSGKYKRSSQVVDNYSGYATASPALADCLSEVFTKLGCTAPTPKPFKDVRNDNWSLMYYGSVYGRFSVGIEPRPGLSETHNLVHYKGYVHCCTVENHLLITRRNGKILVSGNSNPKTSWVSSKLIAKPQDYVGRGVITPDPELGMDEISVPADIMWTIADPHIQRRLVAQGIPTSRAMALIKERHPTALRVLEQVMRDIPVMYSRSPAWHKYNLSSGYAKLSKGDTIQVSNLVTSSSGADFDGDTMSIHMPSMPESIKDAKEKLLPSKMAFAIRNRDEVIQVPKHEHLLGLAGAQIVPSGKVHTVRSQEEALAGIKNGSIRLQDHVEIDPNHQDPDQGLGSSALSTTWQS